MKIFATILIDEIQHSDNPEIVAKPKKTAFKVMYSSATLKDAWPTANPSVKSFYTDSKEAENVVKDLNSEMTPGCHSFYFLQKTEVDA